MKKRKMRLKDRVHNYNENSGFPNPSLFIGGDGRIVGTWIMGNNYQVKMKYYGGYPHGYLKRIKLLFPDKKKVLHLFSGMVDQDIFPGDTVDINNDLKPTYIDDAQELKNVPLDKYNLILADPPYSVEDATHYQTTMIKRNKVMKALSGVKADTFVVWLDQVLPMFRKDTWKIVGVIGMVKSTNHRFRVITIFQRIRT